MTDPIINLKENQQLLKQDPKEQFALDVLMGLSSNPKSLPPKYFYDDEGSRLFAKITDLDEYYPTHCEREIFELHKKEIVDQIGVDSLNLVELGAGDGRKTKIILNEMLQRQCSFKYIPVDISEGALETLLASLKSNFPSLETQAIAAEYFSGLKWLSQEVPGRKCVFMLGGNIGNFDMPQAKVFLRTLWNALNDGDLLLTGFDLKKSIAVLLQAYNDSQGVTSAFNLNLLKRMNRELGANFDVETFQHFGTYNTKLGAMESFILSLKKQDIYIKELNKTFHFEPYEPIHTEFSFKFLPSEIDELVEETGFEMIQRFEDSRRFFVDALLRVNKDT